MKNNIIEKIKGLIPILFFLGLIAALSYSIYYSCKLEEQIWERDRTIQELSFRSKLVEDYFDIIYNPADSTTSYVLKETKRNIITQKDTIMLQGNSTITCDELIEEYNSLIQEYKVIIDEFNSLVAECNSLAKEKLQEKTEKKRLEDVLTMIEKKYKISYEISIDSNTITTRLRNTDMVDSAIILLPYYRDKIERKPNGLWIITH